MIRKTVLFFLTLISIYAIFCIGLNIFPTISDISNSDNINRVLLNLSYSYIAGCIFYLLVTYFPYRSTKNKLKPAINIKIKNIGDKTLDIAQCFSSSNIGSLDEIKEQILIEYVSSKSIYSICSQHYTLGINLNILEYVISQREDIKKSVDELLHYKEYMPERKIMLLEIIRESNFFYQLNLFFLNNNIDNVNVRTKLAKELFLLIQNVKTLSDC